MAILTKAGIQRSAYGTFEHLFDNIPDNEDGLFPLSVSNEVGKVEFSGHRYKVEIVATLVKIPSALDRCSWKLVEPPTEEE